MLKKVLILVDKKNDNDSFRDFIKNNFEDFNWDLIIVNEDKSYHNSEIVEIDNFLVVTEYVFNFLDFSENYEKIQKKIEDLKIEYFGNSLTDVKLFSEKNNFKKIIEKSEFKTPVFDKINDKNALDIFNNFYQPSRIFSKKNDYFSEKITSLKKLQEIFEQEKNLQEYYVEEFIEGQELVVLITQDINKNIIISIVKKENYQKIDSTLEKELKEKIKSFFEYSELKDFAIIDLIYSEKRGLYFLNIWIKNIELIKKQEYIKNITNEERLKDIFLKDLF